MILQFLDIMIQINCDAPHDMAVNVRNNIINYYYVLSKRANLY